MSLLIPLVVLLVLEYIADFLLQPRDMALKKSEDFGVLVKHCAIIASVLLIGMTFLPPVHAILLAISNAVIHGIVDWNIWKIYKAKVFKEHVERAKQFVKDPEKMDLEGIKKEVIKSYKYWEDKRFYDTIGLDRLLHIITLILLYGWIIL